MAKTWEEHKAECEAVAKPGITILGYVGGWKGHLTKLNCSCHEHGVWETTSVAHFKAGRSCPECGRQALKKSCEKSDEDHIQDFMKTGVFPKGTMFTRSKKKGINQYWNVFCPICANDEYASNGLCSGFFCSFESSLKAGIKSCRCSGKYRYTKEQWKWRLSKECMRKGYTFKDFLPGKLNNKCNFKYVCPEHGEQMMTASALFAGNGCPECRGRNQHECYINTVYDGSVPLALKFGISKNSENRLKRQNYCNVVHMNRVALYEFKTSILCKTAETECKKVLQRGVVSKQDMPDGWTETVALTDYAKVVSIYERFGGVLVQEEK